MKDLVTNIRSDKIVLRGFILSSFFIALTLAYILVNYRNLPPFVPVFNQLPWGTQRLTQTSGIFIPIIIFFLIFFINLIISSIVYSKNPLISRVVAATTLMISVINFLSTIRIILLL